jgi:hypothetical protein
MTYHPRMICVMVLVAIFAYPVSSFLSTRTAYADDYTGHTVGLAYAEVLTQSDSGTSNHVIYFRQDVGNGQSGDDFVYNDPRRAALNGGNPGVTFGVKTGFLSSDANLTDQVKWLRNSLYRWASLSCSKLSLTENTVNPTSTGAVEWWLAGGGFNPGLVDADITQIGFRGAGPIFADGSDVLSVTYTVYWYDEQGNASDIDNNGKNDVAFREIYYNDQYEWADNGVEGFQPDGTYVYDLPTAALHEAGHGLSADHFGNVGIKNGKLVASPRAVMNGVYIDMLRELTGRDTGIHCSNWAQWPNR